MVLRQSTDVLVTIFLVTQVAIIVKAKINIVKI